MLLANVETTFPLRDIYHKVLIPLIRYENSALHLILLDDNQIEPVISIGFAPIKL